MRHYLKTASTGVLFVLFFCWGQISEASEEGAVSSKGTVTGKFSVASTDKSLRPKLVGDFERLKQSWSQNYASKKVVVTFTVETDGSLKQQRLLSSSGVFKTDRSVLGLLSQPFAYRGNSELFCKLTAEGNLIDMGVSLEPHRRRFGQ